MQRLEDIVFATPEQVERIRRTSDLGSVSQVLAMGDDLAVIKTVTEIDPVYFADNSNVSRRRMFIWGIENVLRVNGVPAYYFNVDSSDEPWQKVVTNYGAERVSKTPEYRFVKVL